MKLKQRGPGYPLLCQDELDHDVSRLSYSNGNIPTQLRVKKFTEVSSDGFYDTVVDHWEQ